MISKSFTSKIICYKKGDHFLAVALDFDLMDQGICMIEALQRLESNIQSYLKVCIEDNETDDEIYRKAPQKYFDLLELFQELDNKKKDSMSGQRTFNTKDIVKHTCSRV